MSDKTKIPWEMAMPVAEEIHALLKPCCVDGYIHIAGSLRRLKKYVGDVELSFVPRIIQEPDGLFDTKPVSLADSLIETWLASGFVTKRMATTGRISSYSALNKHLVHASTGISLDLFADPSVEDYPRTLAIRTGSREFNIELMATAPKNGYNAHAYGESLHKIPTGERVIPKDERDFIDRCGLKYREPKDR